MQWESVIYTYGSARQPPESELEHYGIRGQRWGTRRFQNPDGTLTAEGKVRYRKDESRPEAKNPMDRFKKKHEPNIADKLRNSGKKASGGLKTKGQDNKKNRRDWKPEDAENLSDEELNRRNSRMQREQQYKESTTPKWKKEAKNTAKDWTKEAVKRIFVATAVTLAVAAMTKQYKKAQANISQYASHKMSEVRQPSSTKNAIRNAVNRYSNGGNKARDIRKDRDTFMNRLNEARSRGKQTQTQKEKEDYRFNWNAHRR